MIFYDVLSIKNWDGIEVYKIARLRYTAGYTRFEDRIASESVLIKYDREDPRATLS